MQSSAPAYWIARATIQPRSGSQSTTSDTRMWPSLRTRLAAPRKDSHTKAKRANSSDHPSGVLNR